MKPDIPGGYWSGDLSLGSLTGPWVGPARCLDDYPTPLAPVPYGPDNAAQNMSLLVEEGFKHIRGAMAEGHFLVFEQAGMALTNPGGAAAAVTAAPATPDHADIHQRWVVHYVGDPLTTKTFHLQSALDGRYVGRLGALTADVAQARAYDVAYEPVGSTYSLAAAGRCTTAFVSVDRNATVSWRSAEPAPFKVFSVSYHQ